MRGIGFLSGFTVEDTNVIQVTELSGYYLFVLGFMHFKIWPLREYENFVVSLDVQPTIGQAALPIDTSDGEVTGVADLHCGDHGQVDHSICKTGD